jgi:hypothetical protein
MTTMEGGGTVTRDDCEEGYSMTGNQMGKLISATMEILTMRTTKGREGGIIFGSDKIVNEG